MKRFLLLLCLCSLFLFCFQLNSYASVDINEIDSNVYKLYQKNAIPLSVYNAYKNANNLTSGNIYNTRNNLVSACNNSLSVGYSILILNYNGYSSTGSGLGTPNLVVLITKGNVTNSTSDNNCWTNLKLTATYKWDGTNANYSSSNSGFYGNKGTPTWAYTTSNISTTTLQLNAYEEYGAYYLTSPLIFNKSTTSNINITVNGITKSIPLYKYSRSVNSFMLGYFTGWENQQIELSVGPYVSNDIVDASWGKCQINYWGDVQNGNKIGFLKNGDRLEVYCTLPYYLYNQTYEFLYTYKTQDEDNWNNKTFTFYILPNGSTQTSGELINPELDNDTDVAFVNTIDQMLSYNSGDIQNDNNYVFGLNSFGNLYSGDLFSGDLLGKIGFEDYTSENDYNLFIYRIYRNVLNIFVGANETANESISFTLHGHTYTIYARDFFIPEGPLKVFIRLFLVAGMVILFIQQIYKIVINFTIFDFKGVSRTFDQDQTFFM